MKSWNMKGYWIKTAIFSLAFMFVYMGHALSQFKAGEGLYVLVNFVPEECKVKVDGHFMVPKDSKISFSFSDVQIDVARDIEMVREELRKAIHRNCHQKFPGRDVFPDLYIIPDADVRKSGDGVMITGQAGKPGLIPMKDGLTVYQAIQAAGGGTEFSTMRHVAILRENKIIDCDHEQGD